MNRINVLQNYNTIDTLEMLRLPTCITTIVPTAVATWAALGVGGSPMGVILEIKAHKFIKITHDMFFFPSSSSAIT